MEIIEKTIDKKYFHADTDDSGFGYICEMISGISPERVLAINPGNGAYLSSLSERKIAIDSFVSDDEWIDAARLFSNQVFNGHSHRALLQIADATYDLVIVCEDMSFIDDCDAMLQTYFRLLKPSGALLGGLWNISYADNIDKLLCGKGIERHTNLCGYSIMPLDCLTARLCELGFEQTMIHVLHGGREDVTKYAEVSTRNVSPVPPETFKAKIYFINAYKKV